MILLSGGIDTIHDDSIGVTLWTAHFLIFHPINKGTTHYFQYYFGDH
jgi:hypothetical protein